MMKTMMMCVVMAFASIASAETDAEKIARLEKENIELRNQVQAQKQAIAVLQRKVEALTKPAADTNEKNEKPADGPVAKLDSIAAMIATIPKASLPPQELNTLNEVQLAVLQRGLEPLTGQSAKIQAVFVRAEQFNGMVDVHFEADANVRITKGEATKTGGRQTRRGVVVERSHIRVRLPMSELEMASKLTAKKTYAITGQISTATLSVFGVGDLELRLVMKDASIK